MDLNVVSLFDGMSCGRLALERAGLGVNVYYSSEVDKFAIQTANKNYPQDSWTRLGDVRNIDPSIFAPVHLLMGGSPCQSFSFAGKQAGMSTRDNAEILTLDHYLALKSAGFEFEGQSYLFWEYVRLLEAVRPKYFLLENVIMTKKWERVISGALDVEPIMINSALVSAQNRKRLYWTNIPGVSQPGDQGILLRDILEDGFADRDKSLTLTATYHKGGSLKEYLEKSKRQLVIRDKAQTITNCYEKKTAENMVKRKETGLIVGAIRTHGALKFKNEKSQCIDANYHKGPDNHRQRTFCIRVGEADIKGHDSIRRVDAPEGKVPTVTTMGGGNREPKVALDNVHWRKLTPLECERLQTVPDNYTEGVSKTQRYKMLGNGWTIDVIAHILRGIKL